MPASSPSVPRRRVRQQDVAAARIVPSSIRDNARDAMITYFFYFFTVSGFLRVHIERKIVYCQCLCGLLSPIFFNVAIHNLSTPNAVPGNVGLAAIVAAVALYNYLYLYMAEDEDVVEERDVIMFGVLILSARGFVVVVLVCSFMAMSGSCGRI